MQGDNSHSAKNVYVRVAVYDHDFYSLMTIGRYLALDRRTHVRLSCYHLDELWHYLATIREIEYPDVIILSSDIDGGEALHPIVARLRTQIPTVRILCLMQNVDCTLVQQIIESGTNAVFLKADVRLGLSWAVVFSLNYPLVVTRGIARACYGSLRTPFNAVILPRPRDYPELTERIRQALYLSVIFGMPAQLIAREMFVSVNTVRGYIKEGYRILEASNPYFHTTELSPQERAFMWFSALDEEY